MKEIKRFVSKHRRLVGVYMLWILANVIILILSFSEGKEYQKPYKENQESVDGLRVIDGGYSYKTVTPKDVFWPISKGTRIYNFLDSYDYTEYLAYTLGPIVICMALFLIFGKKEIKTE